jgi:hypothetical protein
MSINFDNEANPETREMIEKLFGKPVADDRKHFLMDQMHVIDQKLMKQVANAAKQPAKVELHGLGEIKTLDDGSRYEVTPRGWRKIEL